MHSLRDYSLSAIRSNSEIVPDVPVHFLRHATSLRKFMGMLKQRADL
jgi:hypothetical protein